MHSKYQYVLIMSRERSPLLNESCNSDEVDCNKCSRICVNFVDLHVWPHSRWKKFLDVMRGDYSFTFPVWERPTCTPISNSQTKLPMSNCHKILIRWYDILYWNNDSWYNLHGSFHKSYLLGLPTQSAIF